MNIARVPPFFCLTQTWKAICLQPNLKLEWTCKGAWIWMNPDCNREDLSWIKLTSIFTMARSALSMVVGYLQYNLITIAI